MAIRDYWVYQKKTANEFVSPWALYIVKEFDKRRGNEATFIDYTLYSEEIDNPTHSRSYVGLHHDTVSGYVDEILTSISEYMMVTASDKEQLTVEIERILLD